MHRISYGNWIFIIMHLILIKHAPGGYHLNDFIMHKLIEIINKRTNKHGKQKRKIGIQFIIILYHRKYFVDENNCCFFYDDPPMYAVFA